MTADQQAKAELARQLRVLGLDLEAKGELVNALRLFRQSLDACATAEGYVMGGRVLEKLGRYSVALADYRQALVVDAACADAVAGIARVRSKSN